MTDGDPFDDDDDELELEPIDPEILAMERQRSEERSRKAENAVDMASVEEPEERPDPISWDDLKSFRFTTRHLLIVTALFAVVLTLNKLLQCLGWFIAGVAALAGGWFFVLRKERRDRLQLEQRRREVGRLIATRNEEGEVVAVPAVIVEEEAAEERRFRFSFSMKELIGAMTVAAVLFALVRGLGGPNNAALLLGTLALVGLVVHLIGFDPPPVIVLGWWLLLVLYIVVSLWAAFASSDVAWHTVDGVIRFAEVS